MARLNTYVSMDIRNLDLNWYDRNYYDSGFENNIFAEFNGRTYQDVAWVQGAYNDVIELTLGGFNMTEDWDGNITGGTVQVITETRADGSEFFWSLEGISVSAAALYDAALTNTSADEYQLLASALHGNDLMELSDHADWARGFGGNDRLFGYGGADVLIGDAGADIVDGGAGNDVLRGGVGNDVVRGGLGADRLFGDWGADALYAGNDNAVDRFVYMNTGTSTVSSGDRLYQFDSGEDLIDLSGIDTRSDVAGDQDFLSFGGTTATADGVWYVSADGDGDGAVDDVLLRADTNGDAIADLELAVINTSSLVAGDVLL